MSNNNKRICPVSRAGGLDNRFRRLVQNPQKILKKYLFPGAKVLEFGCGPGFFTLDIAQLIGEEGRVTALDIQHEMLDMVAQKIIKKKDLTDRIILYQSPKDKLGIKENDYDFILMFYVVHEIPDKTRVFKELSNILKPNGKVLIIEPLFHSSKKDFLADISLIEQEGFTVEDGVKVFLSRSKLLTKNS